MSTEPENGTGEAIGGSVADGVEAGAAVVGAAVEVSGVCRVVDVEDGDDVETGSVVDVVEPVVEGASVIVVEGTTVSPSSTTDASVVDDGLVDSAVELEGTDDSGSEAEAVSGAGLSEPHAVASQSANTKTPIHRDRSSARAGISRKRPSLEGDSRAQFGCRGRRFATS